MKKQNKRLKLTRIPLAFLLCCLMISFVSCQSNVPDNAIQLVETKELYRVKGYDSPFEYSIEAYGKKDWWGLEAMGTVFFSEQVRYHAWIDPDASAYLYEEDGYRIEDAEPNFTSAPPLTLDEIRTLLKDFCLDEKEIIGAESDCINGTYVFAIAVSSYNLVSGFDPPKEVIMIGEAKNSEELSSLVIVEARLNYGNPMNFDDVYFGFLEGETFYRQQGEFRESICD